MSRYELVAPRGEMPEEDDSSYTVRIAQDRLKRKKYKRMLIAFVCVVVFFFLVAGIAAGVVMGVTIAGNKGDHTETNAPDKNIVSVSTAVISSSPHSVSQSTSLKVTTSRPSATKDNSKTFTTTHSHSHKASSTTVVSTSVTSASPWATTTSVSPSPTVIPVNTFNSQILNYIDTSYDPCENFYEYSCGQWYDRYPDASEWGAFQDLALDNYNRIGKYLSHYVDDYRDPDAIKKAKYIYSACINSDYISRHLVTELKNFMIYKAGGWENGDFSPYNSWSINNNLYQDHYLGSSAFFTFGVEPDDLDSTKQVIRIRQAGLTYSLPEKYQGESFSKLITTIENILKAFNSRGNYYYIAYNIAHFERSLADHWLTEAELRNASALYNPMTLDELSRIFSLDWVSYFNNYFTKAGYTGSFTGSTMVIVETPSYFRAVNSYLTRSSAVDYAKWQLLVNEVALYTASLPQDNWRTLQEIKFPKTSKLSQDTKLNCIELVEGVMPLAVARPFVEELITDTTKVNVAEVASQIKIAFKQRVMEKTWLDETTKDRTMEKVDAITEQIAYPDFIKIDRELNSVYADLDVYHYITYFNALGAMRKFIVKKMISRYFHSTDKTEWLDPPTEVNAYYTPQFNQFVILAGILRPPFYAANWSPFLIYGALGTVIGHELTHGFDDQGQQYNKNGNRIKWWTSHSISNFKRRTQCFVNQYDRYSLQGNWIDGQLTLGENIADNGGVHTAFRAYKNVMRGVSEQYVKGHSGDQLFFVAFAQLWCSRFTSEALEVSTKTDPHSPGPIRVRGSLVNSEEFATAFQCSVGSTMYPSDNRCELW